MPVPGQIEGGPNFVLSSRFVELFEQSPIQAELSTITVAFLGEKQIQVGARVVTGLVIDDPAYAIFVNEGAIHHCVDEPIVDQSGDGQFAGGIGVSTAQQPATGIIVERALKAHPDRRGVGIHGAFADAGCAQQFGDALDQPVPKGRVEVLDTESACVFEKSMQYGSGATSVDAGPVEFDVDGEADYAVTKGKAEQAVLATLPEAVIDLTAQDLVLTPSSTPAGEGRDLFALEVVFFQEMNGEMYPLYDGTASTTAIIGVS